MNLADCQAQFQKKYDRENWHALLPQLLPGVELFASAQDYPLTNDRERTIATARRQFGAATLADGKRIAFYEIDVAAKVDLLRNRVALREIVARCIDEVSAHAVLAFFVHPDKSIYRLTYAAKESRLGDDLKIHTEQTATRRYTYVLGPGETRRTAASQMARLSLIRDKAKIKDVTDSFSVEPLFKEFFRDYGRVFDEVESLVKPSLADKETLRLFTQRLFNRLMFLAFIERKGWLKLDDRTDYLAALWDSYAGCRKSGSSFYREHLVPLFFEGLNQPDRPPGQSDPRFGIVPYLNGGLFEKADDGSDDRAGIVVPDKALESILTELFARYNFTVAESTPLDIEVAVDPEMLGKVFEELVTGRHEQGSYYTPKPIVSFMCREALVEFLATRCPKEKRAALEAFVHDHHPPGLADAETVLAALRSVTVCDPACGSGAYLLGMLHELLDLRTCLFATNQKLDASTAHERKLEIIERNLYGVDLDSFAVNIARLRLWLSLAVDFEGKVPPPLPNLDFKIEQGDALAAPAPQELFQRPAVVELRVKKAAFLRAHGTKKQKLWEEIEKAQADLAVWQQAEGTSHGFNWGVEFAEVFLGDTAMTTIGGDLNLGHELAAKPQRGGFDIVVANPPYVRMELIKPQKPVLRKRFPHVHAERADLYIYFYARAQELLRAGGVAAFISSNKWLRSGYGESLRQHLLDAQNFRLVMDFGELGVFDTAATDAAIFLWQKKPRADAVTRWAMVKDLQCCYAEGVRQHFLRLAVDVPASQFGEGKSRLATTATADMRTRMETGAQRLGELCRGILGMGIKTGLNDAFIINRQTRDRLIAETPTASEIIKPLLSGDDVRCYEINYRDSFLIFTYHGVDISRYPSVEKHLRAFRSYKNNKGEIVGLDHRSTEQEWYELQQPQMAYRSIIEGSKIYHPEIGKECRFFLDELGFFPNKTVFFIPLSDWFVLAVLNSNLAFIYLKGVCALLGDENEGGRLLFSSQHLDGFPIPNASVAERKAVGELARKVQALHGQRRKRVERFLRDLGLDPAQSTTRNPLEQPWNLSAAEFAKRAKRQPMKFHESARAETAALTEQIAKLESEINARVATLYGLDAEDQRWAAKSSPSATLDDRQSFFFNVLGKLKERRPYFRLDEIQTAANDAELALKDSSLSVYLTEAVKQGHIHDAGRGWYSRLSEPVPLDAKPVAKLIRAVEKAFPLLDFTVWSTAQINPWMHHLLAQPVTFLYAPADTLESVGDTLREQGWEIALDPGKKAGPKLVRPGEKMLVLRPTLTKQPPSQGRQDSIEKMLVDLVAEAPRLSLMDQSEAEGVVREVLSRYLVQIAEIQSYAKFRKLNSVVFE